MYQKMYWRGYFAPNGGLTSVSGAVGTGQLGGQRERLDEVEGAGASDGLEAALDVELVQDVVDMALDRAHCHD